MDAEIRKQSRARIRGVRESEPASGRAWTDARNGVTWSVHMLPEDWGDHSTPPLGRVQLRFARNGSRTRVVDYETNDPLDALTDDRIQELFDRAE